MRGKDSNIKPMATTRDSPVRDLPGGSVPPDSHMTDTDSDPPTDAYDLGATKSPNVTSPVAVADSQTPTQAQGPETHVVRTRTGRAVKEVDRLIENMVQKPRTNGFVEGVKRRTFS